MSRAYRIRVAESLRRHVQVEDGISGALELLPILTRERMAEILAGALAQRGFERRGNTAVRTEADGAVISIDLETAEVTIRLADEKPIALELERTAAAGEGQQAATEERLRAQLVRELEQSAAAEERELQREVTARLTARLREVTPELDAVVNRVTAEALKVKAGELGTIESISEDPETGSMTIKVRV